MFFVIAKLMVSDSEVDPHILSDGQNQTFSVCVSTDAIWRVR